MSNQEDLAWFQNAGAWCRNLRLLFARGRSWQEMLEAFGLDPAAADNETLRDQARSDHPTVRAGEHQGWGYGVQTMWDPADEQLERLSFDGEAFELAYTETISGFRYATGGALVSGFDMTVPHIRWGDERRFEAQMAEAGFLTGVPNPRIMGPRFVQLAFGLTIPAAIEGPLPGVARRPAPREPLSPAPPPSPISRPGLGRTEPSCE